MDEPTKTKTAKKSMSRSARAGLVLPVSRVGRRMKTRLHGSVKRVSGTSPVALAGVLEYVAIEVVTLAAKLVISEGRRRLDPRDVLRVCRNDTELARVLSPFNVVLGKSVDSKGLI